MLARVDNSHFAYGSHPGIDVDKKDVRFPVAGDSVSFDYMKVWEATPNAKFSKEKLDAHRK